MLAHPLGQALLAWLVYMLVGLAIAWKGVLFLPVVSFLVRLLIDRWPVLAARGRVVRCSVRITGDLLSGLLISAVFYGRNGFLFGSGCAVTVLFVVIYELLMGLAQRKSNTPMSD